MSSPEKSSIDQRLTGVLGLGDDLSQKLGEVGEILSEEVGLNDNGLPGV